MNYLWAKDLNTKNQIHAQSTQLISNVNTAQTTRAKIAVQAYIYATVRLRIRGYRESYAIVLCFYCKLIEQVWTMCMRQANTHSLKHIELICSLLPTPHLWEKRETKNNVYRGSVILITSFILLLPFITEANRFIIEIYCKYHHIAQQYVQIGQWPTCIFHKLSPSTR